MSLSPIKQEILENLLLNDKPMRAVEVAKEIGEAFPPVMMHILALVRMGYLNSPEKGQYVITQKGKEALGLPEIDKRKATAILAYLPYDNAFHFYDDIGKPLDLHAHDIREFADSIEKADVQSVQFHMNRGDFEAWFKSLGDYELAMRVALLKKKNLDGEDLRNQLHQIVDQRYVELAKLAGQPVDTQ
ncbi:MAG TPA: DUF5752 family protein [Candidatus Limnocylindrales bacterium]|nr:DUF5752 family protein [Candidatus Limnocylindrales bacterium]